MAKGRVPDCGSTWGTSIGYLAGTVYWGGWGDGGEEGVDAGEMKRVASEAWSWKALIAPNYLNI